eukprot:scaffold986_cov237-Pinguiococcus_pyrenoidosus.AAC.24
MMTHSTPKSLSMSTEVSPVHAAKPGIVHRDHHFRAERHGVCGVEAVHDLRGLGFGAVHLPVAAHEELARAARALGEVHAEVVERGFAPRHRNGAISAQSAKDTGEGRRSPRAAQLAPLWHSGASDASEREEGRGRGDTGSAPVEERRNAKETCGATREGRNAELRRQK